MMMPYYQEDGITIYHGDCREILPHLEPVDLVLTDPPYTSPVVASFGRTVQKHLGDLSIQKFYIKGLVREIHALCSRAAVFCDDVYSSVLMEQFYEWPTCQLLVWDKGRIGMGTPFRRQHEFIVYASHGGAFFDQKTRSTIFRFLPVPSDARKHGAQKPLPLIADLVSALSPPEGSILDPFMGSGTTLVAAKQLSRKAIGIEIEEKYCQIAVDRLRQGVLF